MATRKITYLQISNTGSTNGQVLMSNGTAVIWSNTSSGGFTNGQSISVNNFVITGAVTANSSNGTSGQVLSTNGSAVYWANSATSTSANTVIDSYTANGTQNTFTLSSSVSNQNNVIVSLNGLVLTPATHFTVSGTTLTLTFTPANNDLITARNTESGAGGGGGGGISTGKSIAMAIVFGG